MSINLLDLAKGQIGNMLAQKAASFLGEDAGITSKAVGAILPTLLGGLAGKASTIEGAAGLFSLLKDGKHDGGILDTFGDMLGGGTQTNGLVNAGTSIISSLLGDKAAGIVNLIASFSGMRGSSATSLMSMAAPLVMGLIGKQVGSGGLNAGGLGSLLASQAPFLKAALPAGMGNMLGIGNLLDGNPSPAKVNVETPRVQAKAVESTSNASFGSLLPWLAAAGLLLGALFYWNTCRKPAIEPIVPAVDTVTTVIQNVGTAVMGMINKALPGGAQIDFAPTGVENSLISFIEDSTKIVDKTTWFSFDRLYFETGKATLADSSNAQLDNIVAIMKAYPNVALKIGGYTDNTGDAKGNVALSKARAENTMKALVTRGIGAARLAAEGYGDQFPKGDNATEQGRAANRRIDVRVSKK